MKPFVDEVERKRGNRAGIEKPAIAEECMLFFASKLLTTPVHTQTTTPTLENRWPTNSMQELQKMQFRLVAPSMICLLTRLSLV